MSEPPRARISMAGPVLDIRGLRIALPRDGDRPEAVSAVSFTVAAGEIVCLVGESGSGKSVIAYSAMGLLPQSLPIVSGTIELQGENLVGASEFRLRQLRCTQMGMIFQ